MSSSRRSSSYTLSGTGTGTVTSSQMSSAQTSFTTALTSQLLAQGFSGVIVQDYTYSVDSEDDELCLFGLCGYVLYGAAGGAFLLLVCICYLCCRHCAWCPCKKTDQEKQQVQTPQFIAPGGQDHTEIPLEMQPYHPQASQLQHQTYAQAQDSYSNYPRYESQAPAHAFPSYSSQYGAGVGVGQLSQSPAPRTHNQI